MSETSPSHLEELARGERRLSGLTAEQFAFRFERLKAEMMAQNPFLARHWKVGGKAQEKMVRARLIRELANEPMDLMIIYPPTATGTQEPHHPQNSAL